MDVDIGALVEERARLARVEKPEDPDAWINAPNGLMNYVRAQMRIESIDKILKTHDAAHQK